MIFKAATTAECRAAIAAGNFGAADRLLGELRAEVEAAWPLASPEERQTLAAQVLDLLRWARQTTLAKRSHIQKRLREIDCHSAYLPARAARNRCVELDG
jgi:hypothetical protein